MNTTTTFTLTKPQPMQILSEVLGWIYFAAWSLSFYGQVIENYRRKKVSGLKFDYELYNLFGFGAYTIYTIIGYNITDIGTGIIPIHDIFFAAHGFVLTIVHLLQICYYYDKNDANQKIDKFTIAYITTLLWGEGILLITEFVAGNYDPRQHNSFNSIVYLGWVKVFISLIKYIPQAYFNYKRKSTIGWNIHNILLDFTGGSFSFAQNIVDSFIKDDGKQSDSGSGVLNLAKFALSFETMFFDIIFILQHYVFYRHANSDLGKNRVSTIDENKIEESEDPLMIGDGKSKDN